MKKVKLNETEIQTAETSETLEKKDKDWEQLCKRLNELQEKVKTVTNEKRRAADPLQRRGDKALEGASCRRTFWQ